AGLWCRRLKREHPALTIVWGGYFPSIYTEAVCRDPGVDLVVRGQGEDTVVELLQVLQEGGDPTEVPGVSAWRDARLITAPSRRLVISSRYPDPPYERLPMERYAARTFLGARTFNHHTTVGCPYVCNFCGVTSLYQGRWLADPARDVIRVVRRLHDDYGADAIEFHDNNFFAAERRCIEVSRGITDLGVRWWGEGRIDTMLGWSGETWESMSRSGLTMVFFGAESGDQRALEAMDKGGLQVEQTRELNRLALRHDVVPEFSFVLGNPGDPEGDVAASLELIRELKRDNPACEIILYMYTPVPLPGMYDDAESEGFELPDSLDQWLSPRWQGYESRRDPGTPWATGRLVRKVRDFETVLNARWPTASDRNLRPWQRTVLRALSLPRYRTGLYRWPLELRVLQRVWAYRRPEEMGF
ncbi:MAG: radical SAM protein, partial [Myxococcota bacterium]|nr:radical SAM protein [Myxococcota bacterium]